MSQNETNEETRIKAIPCNECIGGVLRLTHQSYFLWTGKDLITIPNFPAWLCDVCGWREYDPQAEYWFNTIFGEDLVGGYGQTGFGDENPLGFHPRQTS